MHRMIPTALLFAAAACSAAQAPWSYEGHTGPQVWDRLDRAYAACGKGREQSPVDIKGAKLNKSLQPLEYHYVSGSVTLENDGRILIAHVNPGSYLVAGGTRYELQEIEFHRPSEHPVKRKLTDMEVQLVHKSAEGKYAIVAVRLSQVRGDPNAVMSILWEHLPRASGQKTKVTEMVNAAGLLPGDPGYWTYTGSLSTPPCTEGVQWYVYEQEVSISRNQLRNFQAIFKIDTRPEQSLNGRRIEANE